MVSSFGLATVAGLAGIAAAQYQNTATAASSVYAAQATAKARSPVSHVPGRAFDRIAIVWLENTDYDKAAGDPNLSWLAERGLTLTNYFGTTHPSQPNYVASHSGDQYGMDNDDLIFIPSNVSTVVDLLEERGISWGAYQQDMPYTGYEGFNWLNQETRANDYVRKHDPPIIHNSNTQVPQRLQQIKNFTLFYDDLANNRLPQWMFITPNMTSDGHDTDVTVAGAFTRGFLEPLLDDPNFMHNTLVLVTFDENETYTIQNRVFTIVLGDALPKDLVGTTDANFYNHYSELATVEANWDLFTLGRWDVGANVFKFVADRTGDQVRAWPAATGPNPTHFFNESYAGAYNSENYHAIPAPNVFLQKNGRVVLPSITEQWIFAQQQTIYKDTVEIPDGMFPPRGYAGYSS